jgi:hypothetical protein
MKFVIMQLSEFRCCFFASANILLEGPPLPSMCSSPRSASGQTILRREPTPWLIVRKQTIPTEQTPKSEKLQPTYVGRGVACD